MQSLLVSEPQSNQPKGDVGTAPANSFSWEGRDLDTVPRMFTQHEIQRGGFAKEWEVHMRWGETREKW